MPAYTYRCECGQKLEAHRKIDERHDAPEHCGRTVSLEITPTMVAVFTPYQAMGRERRWITNRADHEAYLRYHGYEEVGNDSSMAPPDISDEEHDYNRQRHLAEIRRDMQENERIIRESGINLENSVGES